MLLFLPVLQWLEESRGTLRIRPFVLPFVKDGVEVGLQDGLEVKIRVRSFDDKREIEKTVILSSSQLKDRMFPLLQLEQAVEDLQKVQRCPTE